MASSIGRGKPPRVGNSSTSKPLANASGIKKTGGNGKGGKTKGGSAGKVKY